MGNPQVGEMVLYDYIRPPLFDGAYRMRVGTDVTVKGQAQPLADRDMFFDVEGPRFALSPSEVAGVFPPRNGHGPFDSALPHIALGRRTLPWERALGDAYTALPDQTPYPWLALVVFEESECTLKRNQTLETVVPKAVFERMGKPARIRCDAVEADEALLRDILPMPAELQLLTHVRQVNVDDRELAAGDSDGYFAVVMANRVPSPGAKHVVCLVSVEERTDLLPTTDQVQVGGSVVYEHPELVELASGASYAPLALGGKVLAQDIDRLAVVVPDDKLTLVDATAHFLIRPKAQLVLLHSWNFTCEGDATFRQLLQHVDVAMMGEVDAASKLAVTDTGHVQIDVTDRLGAPERSWYRGPLVGQPLSRDQAGPYHSADQARRVAADTGAEDVSYAGAFEIGRLLAAADGRLGQELMRWRRGAYRSSARASTIDLIATLLRIDTLLESTLPLATRYAVSALSTVARGIGPLVDPYGIDRVTSSPLLRPELVQRAFGLEANQVSAFLGGDVLLGGTVETAPVAPVANQGFDDVVADTAGRAHLDAARVRVLDNVKNVSLRGQR